MIHFYSISTFLQATNVNCTGVKNCHCFPACCSISNFLSLYSIIILFNLSLGTAEHDTEGRVITAEYADFFLVTSCEFLILSIYAFSHVVRLT